MDNKATQKTIDEAIDLEVIYATIKSRYHL